MNAAPMEPGNAGRDPMMDGGGLDPADGPLDDREAFDEAAVADAGLAALPDGPRAGTAPAASDAQLAQWLDAVVDQNERALAALYDATVSRVYVYVRRILRSDTLAEEVVEDTYFQVWRQAVRYDGGRGTAMAWLLSMARSRAIDARRRESRLQHESLDEDGAADAPDGAAPVDDLLDVARYHADLQQALLQLGAQPRQLVSLAFFRGLSHEEIAEQMSLPLGTVKSQIRRALLALRQLLADSAPFASAS